MLLTGLDLLCNLLGVFNQFHERKHPITADFEGMYIQVSVNTEYRKFLRFLWGAEEPVIFFSTLGFVFRAKSSPTCAIYGFRTCANDKAKNYPQIR